MDDRDDLRSKQRQYDNILAISGSPEQMLSLLNNDCSEDVLKFLSKYYQTYFPFYNDKLNYFKTNLESLGHEIYLPNCHDCPETEAKYRGTDKHSEWKASMIRRSEEVISKMDAVLVLNFNKNGVDNYIGGATFLEIYDAFRMNKKIYFVNPIPEGMLKDELIGFSPIIINDNLEKIV